MNILVVEDEIKLAQALKTILITEGYTAETVFDGQQGYLAGKSGNYDCVLLDINLPSMDGITVCQRWRQEGMSVPVIMLTARDLTADRVMGLDAGADDYLIKPFETEELLARIRALLRRQTNKVTLITIADLVIDTQSELVSRLDREIDLSAKEYSMLRYLAERAGGVVSKEELLTQVWGKKEASNSNVVDVYVGYIRKKIDRAFPKSFPLLHTIKGRGYRLGLINNY